MFQFHNNKNEQYQFLIRNLGVEAYHIDLCSLRDDAMSTMQWNEPMMQNYGKERQK